MYFLHCMAHCTFSCLRSSRLASLSIGASCLDFRRYNCFWGASRDFPAAGTAFFCVCLLPFFIALSVHLQLGFSHSQCIWAP